MRILHLSTYDVNGGAARAIHRVHRGLLALGEDSSLLVRRKFSADPTVQAFCPDGALDARWRRLKRQRAIVSNARHHLIEAFDPDRSPDARVRHRFERWAMDRQVRRYPLDKPTGCELFSDDRCALGPELVQRLPAADIVNLNWVAGFVDYETFFRGLPPGLQLVWRLPDMNAFTGGCHYDAGCGRYVESCGDCPQLAFRGGEDLSRRIWRRKKEAYDHLADRQLQVVAISSSQADEVRRSSLLSRFPLTVIPCGVDLETFRPQSMDAARCSLDLPPDKPILLMVADRLQRPSKGGALLAAALPLVDVRHRPMLMTVGEGKPPSAPGLEHLHWGPVHDDSLLARLYNAADLLAFPSLQEGFGQTIVEALACGLPVAGFNTGGMRDAIRPGTTGFIAAAKTADALAGALQAAFEDLDRLRGLSQACRETAERQFAIEVVARRYRDLYRDLLAAI